ncbi:MAG: histidinol-phosphate transaminase [Rhodobacter sp.]|nr:histidinol-phosphate transaminase [Rhodobacter sp.]MCY4169383.1 histidinol-phosphate transaminase [Rhodobacter sp.]MCY4241881.1 histidinol-phosphate transaminase [Rhodobacter sp.]
MATVIVPKSGIMAIDPYVGGRSSLPGRDEAVKLSSNENPFGASPYAVDAYRIAAQNLHRYPPSDHHALRTAIGDLHALEPDRIICGAGSDEIIGLLCHAYAGPGDEVLHTEHGFLMYRISALASGATPIAVRESHRVTDVDALLDACSRRTRLVFIANPNNPTGTMIDDGELSRLVNGMPRNAMLVLDGAYAEYVNGFDGGAGLARSHDRVFMTRTFSKLYGLGGLRVGWGYGHRDVIDVLGRIRAPFNLGTGQLAAAEAALRDREFAGKCVEENTRWREWLAGALATEGIPSDRSHANFILARFADAEEADACNARLNDNGLIVRKVGNYGLPECLRITVGNETSCRRVAETVRAFRKDRQ